MGVAGRGAHARIEFQLLQSEVAWAFRTQRHDGIAVLLADVEFHHAKLIGMVGIANAFIFQAADHDFALDGADVGVACIFIQKILEFLIAGFQNVQVDGVVQLAVFLAKSFVDDFHFRVGFHKELAHKTAVLGHAEFTEGQDFNRLCLDDRPCLMTGCE